MSSSQSSFPRQQQQQQRKKKIRPPTTTVDDGRPTDSCMHDVDRVLRLIEDERHFTAQELLHDVHSRLGILRSRQTDPSSPLQSQLSSDSRDSDPTNNKRQDGAENRKGGKLRLRPFHFHRQQHQHTKVNRGAENSDKDREEARAVLEANQEILDKLEVRLIDTGYCSEDEGVDFCSC